MNHKLLSRKQFEYYLLKLQLHLESVPLTSRAVNAMSSLASLQSELIELEQELDSNRSLREQLRSSFRSSLSKRSTPSKAAAPMPSGEGSHSQPPSGAN